MSHFNRDFQDVLTDLDDGQLHEELTRQLREVVRACRAAKQPGALTLKINIRPEGEKQLVVNAKVTPTIPAIKPNMTMFFASPDGDLLKDDPKQLPLKHVPMKPEPLRTLGSDNAGKGA
jgi:hypothetical protein